jgi:hypothetical protein
MKRSPPIEKRVKAPSSDKQQNIPEPLLSELEIGLWAPLSKLALFPEWLRSKWKHAVLSRKNKALSKPGKGKSAPPIG